MSIKVNLSPEYLIEKSVEDKNFSCEDLFLRAVNGYCVVKKTYGPIITIDLLYNNMLLHFVEIENKMFTLAHIKDLI